MVTTDWGWNILADGKKNLWDCDAIQLGKEKVCCFFLFLIIEEFLDFRWQEMWSLWPCSRQLTGYQFASTVNRPQVTPVSLPDLVEEATD